MGDRFSVGRSRYDMQPEDQPAHLIDFTIRGARGAVKGCDVVDARLARRHWRKLGALLGDSGVTLTIDDARVMHRLLDAHLATEEADPDRFRQREIYDALGEAIAAASSDNTSP
jgi:hypothetical protein